MDSMLEAKMREIIRRPFHYEVDVDSIEVLFKEGTDNQPLLVINGHEFPAFANEFKKIELFSQDLSFGRHILVCFATQDLSFRKIKLAEAESIRERFPRFFPFQASSSTTKQSRKTGRFPYQRKPFSFLRDQFWLSRIWPAGAGPRSTRQLLSSN